MDLKLTSWWTLLSNRWILLLTSIPKKHTRQKTSCLCFFAGHGHYVPGRGGHIVAKNSQLNGSLRSYLEFNDISTYFNNIYSCKHMMLVFDVCFGGAAFDKQDAINYSGTSLKQIRDSLDKFVDTKSKIQSRLFHYQW